MISKLKKFLPLLLVVVVALVIAAQNIDVKTIYSGWDNVHPEFSLPQYAYRAIFGAWYEFQGLGAPAAQGYLAEITRLPIIFLLKLLVPDNLNRYVYIFLMFLTGGVGTFLYLKTVWLKNTRDSYRGWIAAFGAVYYLLNLVTLQQFFIAFEMFTVQFAFFPFLLLSIHVISNKINAKSILLFIAVQFLIAPSAHTPTIFYIGAAFSMCYAFFLNLTIQKNLLAALKITLFLCLLTFFVNSYWIIPNLYYLLQNAHYVLESRANRLFDPESLWSVREAGDLVSFVTGAHYLFNWKDFNFGNLQQEYIFDVWRKYIAGNLVPFLLTLFSFFSIGGFFGAIFDFKKGSKRWGLVVIYSLAVMFIWMGALFPSVIIDFIYGFKFVGDAFRNPVTKFSIIYSFTTSVLLCQFYEILITKLQEGRSAFVSKVLPIMVLGISFVAIVYTAWPSFTGNFINQKLKVVYPAEYTEMFSYLKTRPQNLRVLELPFFSQAGWNYYDWSSVGKGNGYQGMGFYFFGFPQPLLTPDFARWVETNDFFYFELRQALNSQNPDQLRSVFTKYNLNLIIVDETAIDQYSKNYDYGKIHQLLGDINARVVWKKNFLTIYEVTDRPKNEKLIVPAQINLVSADTGRVREDYVFEKIGEYVNVDEEKAKIIFPFANLTSLQLDDALFDTDKVSVERNVSLGDYELKIPGVKSDSYTTPVAITYRNHQINIVFPETKIITNNQEINLPQLDDQILEVEGAYETMTVSINGKSVVVNNGEIVYSSVFIHLNEPIQISIRDLGNVSKETKFTVSNGKIFDQTWGTDMTLDLKATTSIKIETQFPVIKTNLKMLSSGNCSWPQTGTTTTSYVDSKVVYTADDFGVNCGHYGADYLTPDYPYLMQMTGRNYNGRSIKLFIDYGVIGSRPEEFLLPQNEFSTTFVLMPIVTNAQSPYSINWETRSYGKQAKNELAEIKFAPFAVDRFSTLELIKKDTLLRQKNSLVVNTSKSYFNFLYLANVNCKTDQCFLGINQSFDAMWLAINTDFKLMPHYRYNNWANLWQIDKSGNVLIVYIPQVVSLLCIFLVGGLTIFVVGRTLVNKLKREQKTTN